MGSEMCIRDSSMTEQRCCRHVSQQHLICLLLHSSLPECLKDYWVSPPLIVVLELVSVVVVNCQNLVSIHPNSRELISGQYLLATCNLVHAHLATVDITDTDLLIVGKLQVLLLLEMYR